VFDLTLARLSDGVCLALDFAVILTEYWLYSYNILTCCYPEQQPKEGRAA